MDESLEIEHAAELKGELPLLTEVVHNFLDLEARTRYAEWLDENGDQQRAAFVRDLSSALANLGPETKIPRLYSYDTSWTNMIGLPLLKAVAEHDLYPLSNFIFKSAKPTLRIELENTIQRSIFTGEETPAEDDVVCDWADQIRRAT